MDSHWIDALVTLAGYVGTFWLLRTMAVRNAEKTLARSEGVIDSLYRALDHHRETTRVAMAKQAGLVQSLQAKVLDMAKRQDGMSKNIVGLRRAVDTIEEDDRPHTMPIRIKGTKFRD